MHRYPFYLFLDLLGMLTEAAVYMLLCVIGLALCLAAVPFAIPAALFWFRSRFKAWWAQPAIALREPEPRVVPESIAIFDTDAKIKAVVQAWTTGKEIEVRQPDGKTWYPCGSDHPCHHEHLSGARLCRQLREYQTQH